MTPCRCDTSDLLSRPATRWLVLGRGRSYQVRADGPASPRRTAVERADLAAVSDPGCDGPGPHSTSSVRRLSQQVGRRAGLLADPLSPYRMVTSGGQRYGLSVTDAVRACREGVPFHNNNPRWDAPSE